MMIPRPDQRGGIQAIRDRQVSLRFSRDAARGATFSGRCCTVVLRFWRQPQDDIWVCARVGGCGVEELVALNLVAF